MPGSRPRRLPASARAALMARTALCWATEGGGEAGRVEGVPQWQLLTSQQAEQGRYKGEPAVQPSWHNLAGRQHPLLHLRSSTTHLEASPQLVQQAKGRLDTTCTPQRPCGPHPGSRGGSRAECGTARVTPAEQTTNHGSPPCVRGRSGPWKTHPKSTGGPTEQQDQAAQPPARGRGRVGRPTGAAGRGREKNWRRGQQRHTSEARGCTLARTGVCAPEGCA